MSSEIEETRSLTTIALFAGVICVVILAGIEGLLVGAAALVVFVIGMIAGVGSAKISQHNERRPW